MYINTSFKYHRVTCAQSCVITKVHDLLGQPSYLHLCNDADISFVYDTPTTHKVQSRDWDHLPRHKNIRPAQ